MLNLPTPYPEVNAVLDMLSAHVQVILGNRFVGMYLNGSLAYGDFNQQTSDIDFLVVTAGFLPSETFSVLKDMHIRLFLGGLAWSQKLEGAYLPKSNLRRHDPAYAPVPWLGVDGHFALETLGSDWIIQRWILREKGLVISGPPLAGLIDPVSQKDLRQAVLGSLREWWSPPFPCPERFQNDEYLVYAILTMCRSLYVLENGCVASNPPRFVGQSKRSGNRGFPWFPWLQPGSRECSSIKRKKHSILSAIRCQPAQINRKD